MNNYPHTKNIGTRRAASLHLVKLLCIMHCALCIVHYALCIMHYALCIVYCCCGMSVVSLMIADFSKLTLTPSAIATMMVLSFTDCTTP